MSLWTGYLWRRWTSWLHNGPPTIPQADLSSQLVFTGVDSSLRAPMSRRESRATDAQAVLTPGSPLTEQSLLGARSSSTTRDSPRARLMEVMEVFAPIAAKHYGAISKRDSSGALPSLVSSWRVYIQERCLCSYFSQVALRFL